jgi:hypothetical protein
MQEANAQGRSKKGDVALIAIVIVGAAVMLFGQYLYASWPPKDGWAALAAASTTAAALIALWLGLSRERDVRRQEREKAGLAAAALAVPLAEQARATRDVVSLLEFYQDFTDCDDAYLEDVANRTAQAGGLVRTEKLDPLVPLPNQAAHRIARALSILSAVERSVRVHIKLGHWARNTTKYRVGRAKQWELELDDAAALLQVGVQECERAADLGAPVPTAEQRYGV